MKIHALQTGTIDVKAAFMAGSEAAGGMLPFLWQLRRDPVWVTIPILAWLIEHPEGLILVDTGDTTTNTPSRLVRTRPHIAPAEEIHQHLQRLGFRVADLRLVLLTHLHSDHANGVNHLPNLPIWASAAEVAHYHSWMGSFLTHRLTELTPAFQPQPFQFRPEPIGTFEQSFPLTKDGRVRVVPTRGHTLGHVSVIVQTAERDYFLAGDVTYTEEALLTQSQQGSCDDLAAQKRTLARVLHYTQQRPTVYLPSHDPSSVRRLQQNQITPQ